MNEPRKVHNLTYKELWNTCITCFNLTYEHFICLHTRWFQVGVTLRDHILVTVECYRVTVRVIKLQLLIRQAGQEDKASEL